MSKTTKIVATLATVAALGIGTFVSPQAAQARDFHHHHHGLFFGGFAAGALIGSAIGYAPYSYGYAPYYDGYSHYAYYDGYGSGCFWARTRVRHGAVWHWRRVWVCE